MAKRVLVVDDSALMRKHLRQILERDGYQIETARNGEEGLRKVHEFQPDLVTLDINMPVMDGLTCLDRIMTEAPCPVLMVSSLTERGATATFEALELGAVDYISKPGGTVSLNMKEIEDEVRAKVATALQARVRGRSHVRARLRVAREKQAVAGPLRVASPGARARPSPPKVVLVGASTGGPCALDTMLRGLPGDFPAPVVICQHMPGRFTAVLAERLNRLTELEVVEARGPTALDPGRVIVAKGDADLLFTKRAGRVLATSVPKNDRYVWHPSVERMVESALEHFEPQEMVCVQLTGMGNDGAKAMITAHRGGARNIVESPESAVVWGMPREIAEAEAADAMLPIEGVAKQLLAWAR